MMRDGFLCFPHEFRRASMSRFGSSGDHVPMVGDIFLVLRCPAEFWSLRQGTRLRMQRGVLPGYWRWRKKIAGTTGKFQVKRR